MSGAASTHLMLELAHARDQGTLGPNEPVPGCSCPICETLAVGGSWSEASHAVEIVRHLALTPPSARLRIARRAQGERHELGLPMRLPAPAVLTALTARVPGAVRSVPKRRISNEPLDVEAARAIPLVQVVSRLALGEPVGCWGEPRVLCPLHDDHRPSLRLNVERGLWYCDPCTTGGDGIRLWMLTRDQEFADAVREMVRR